MDGLFEAFVALPVEVQGAVLTGAVFVLSGFGVVWARLRDRRVAASRSRRVTQIDPVLVPNNERERRRIQAIDFDSQQTLVPAASLTRTSEGPIEQIDLLTPMDDLRLQSMEMPDAATLADAKERVAKVVERTGGPGEADNLTVIRGLSPIHARKLQRLGLTRLVQLGQLDDDDVQAVSILLSYPAQKIADDDWVGQARSARSSV